MKLLIVIPAYNEQDSIESIVERSLAARSDIINNSPVTDVDITVVSDGSTDRTAELAKRFLPTIQLIEFKQNHGYGAAIKEGWRQSNAELLGFLDADGTCDPAFFKNLCVTLEKEDADIVLGSRLSSESKMHLIRRVGNTMFAVLLSAFSSRRVRDTASGMRVVRRTCLPRLMPLPDGLHFTPAMTARAILSDHVKLVEIEMPYHERQGESKLKIWNDGLRFLRVIMEAIFLYRPSRPLMLMSVLSILVAAVLLIGPLLHYLRTQTVLEWMIYRFVVANLFGTVGMLFLCASFLAEKVVRITLMNRPGRYRDAEKAGIPPFLRWVLVLAFVLMVVGGLLVLPSFLELVTTGATYEHWSRFIVMSFFYSTAFILIVFGILHYSLNLIAMRLKDLRSGESDEFSTRGEQ